jgi:hypothetical protein
MAIYSKRKPSGKGLNSGLWVRRLLIGGSPLSEEVRHLIGKRCDPVQNPQTTSVL